MAACVCREIADSRRDEYKRDILKLILLLVPMVGKGIGASICINIDIA